MQQTAVFLPRHYQLNIYSQNSTIFYPSLGSLITHIAIMWSAYLYTIRISTILICFSIFQVSVWQMTTNTWRWRLSTTSSKSSTMFQLRLWKWLSKKRYVKHDNLTIFFNFRKNIYNFFSFFSSWEKSKDKSGLLRRSNYCSSHTTIENASTKRIIKKSYENVSQRLALVVIKLGEQIDLLVSQYVIISAWI